MTIINETGNDDRSTQNQPIDPVTTPTDHKLIALDVDGTIVDHDGHLHPEVLSAAQAVVAAGHQVVISTGRSIGAALPVAEVLGIDTGYIVCANGGMTVRLNPVFEDGYEVVNQRLFDPVPALLAVRDVLPAAKYAVETATGEFLSTERFQDPSFGAPARAVPFDDLLISDAVRMVVFSVDDDAEDFGRAVESIGLHGVTYSVGFTAWLDIAARGVTKASALERLRSRLDIDRANTVAVGDGRNDIEMLGWAHRGVAMGQAPAEVKLAADEVTGTVEEHGLATVLTSLVA
ncbi:MAG: HAD family hydrolase [Galactobacter sp.]|uniref:HAD family hydrolase n=1 Tax=Galactobacter sp. TaxID=2676125 RepID=UPI0025C4F98C|nr:HAD family hydrolase [Galactobacter sp.]